MRTLLAESCPPESGTAKRYSKPRLGFLGAGWIGRNRLEAIANSGVAELVAVADPSDELCQRVAQVQPQVEVLNSLDELLEVGLDGLVIATPGALHAEQAVAALERGVAVFCQKPLGRTSAETRRVIAAAQAANLLLGVDLSHRFIGGARKLNDLCRDGELGEIYAVDLVFHNACGPEQAWFYDKKLSGGGCVIDLGIHLMDLALWNLGFPKITKVSSRLFAQGKQIQKSAETVEDYAIAQLDLDNGATVKLACSWKLPAGCEAVIGASFYGTKGGGAFHNVNGSLDDFTAHRFDGTKRQLLAGSPAAWGGRAAVDWAERLAGGGRFNPDIADLGPVAESLDQIYENSGA